MVNLFKKDESIKPYGGYKLTFYPDEFVLPGGKAKQLLHIHVIGQEGEIRVYLLIKEKSNLYIETKRGANFSQPKIIACQTNKEKLTAELDDGRKGSNIYFPDIDEILPARVLSKGLFSSCDEDMDTNVDEEKKEAANNTNFVRMFVEIRAEKWSSFIDRAKRKLLEEVVLIFNEKVISKKDIGHITNKLIPTSYLENNFLAILLNRKDAGLNIQARKLCRDNEGDGIIVGVNYKNVYACIIERSSTIPTPPPPPTPGRQNAGRRQATQASASNSTASNNQPNNQNNQSSSQREPRTQAEESLINGLTKEQVLPPGWENGIRDKDPLSGIGEINQ
ncbi:450_t:CDS:2, partial [Racocetra persica]